MIGSYNLIQGGTFVQSNSKAVVDNIGREGFKLLQKQVATSAFHNSAQRADPPRCHPNTRDAIIQQIFDWMVESRDRDAWLMWLNGAAGAGKSAIAQSIAERCVKEGLSVASYFFSRWDTTRNTMASLVATLAYQIIQAIPTTLDNIIQTIEQNPLIFEQSLESQFESLIIQPLLGVMTLPKAHSNVDCALRRLIVIIDGLDECDNRDLQCSLIKLLGNLLSRRKIPVVFLVCSRAELHLQMAFEQKDLTTILAKLPLDDVAKTSDGIRVYLNDKFAEIKQIHPFRSGLAEDWPNPLVVEQIIAKSSGQFIYASLVMRYISFPNAHPAMRLDIINGIRLRNPSSENPLANLDALYEHIFSEIQSLGMTLDILAYALLSRQTSVAAIEWAFGLATGEVDVFLADLTSVVTCKSKDDQSEQQDRRVIRFLHASLPDFLIDQSRSSAAYYIDSEQYSAKLACMLLKKPPYFPRLAEPYRNNPLLILLQKAKASRPLYKELKKFSINFPPLSEYTPESNVQAERTYGSMGCVTVDYRYRCAIAVNSTTLPYMLKFLYALKTLKFDDDGALYHRYLTDIAKYISLHPGVLWDEETKHGALSHGADLWNMISNEATQRIADTYCSPSRKFFRKILGLLKR